MIACQRDRGQCGTVDTVNLDKDGIAIDLAGQLAFKSAFDAEEIRKSIKQNSNLCLESPKCVEPCGLGCRQRTVDSGRRAKQLVCGVDKQPFFHAHGESRRAQFVFDIRPCVVEFLARYPAYGIVGSRPWRTEV